MTSAPLAFATDKAFRSSGPVCPTRGNVNKLVTMLDMLRFNAHEFLGATSWIAQIMARLNSGLDVSEENLIGCAENLGLMERHCERLGLHAAVQHLRRFRGLIDSSSAQEWFRHLAETQNRIWDELEVRIYLQIDRGLAGYYEATLPLFGQKVFDQFGSAIQDVSEAGNCLALDRGTAVVFHLMRVMESGLRGLARELGIPYAPSWESYLRQLIKIVESDWSAKSDDEKKKQPFYKDAIGDLQVVKVAWRNPTMHIVKSYSPEEALHVYLAVKQFMTRLADAGLSE